jgi:hypothetical protein
MKKMHNKQLHNLYSSSVLNEVKKGGEEHGDVKKEHKIFVTNSRTKRPFTEPKGNF